MREFWTKEQEDALRKYWDQPVNLKAYRHLFGDRSPKAIVAHARKYMGLGPRKKPARQAGWAWDLIKADLLKNGPGMASEIVSRTGLSRAAVNKYLSLAEKGEHGEIHISDYSKRSVGGAPSAVYAHGRGKNADVPAPFTTKEKYRMLRAKKRATSNPFAVAISNVTGVEVISTKGQYKSRVYKEAA